tara:strand:+ start:2912 stop:3166 length:255 start_codon:yes stop_codon:yes gene_type:complete
MKIEEFVESIRSTLGKHYQSDNMFHPDNLIQTWEASCFDNPGLENVPLFWLDYMFKNTSKDQQTVDITVKKAVFNRHTKIMVVS